MLNKFFRRSEFACHCGCGFSTVDAELLEVLTELRERFGPAIITSGARCSEHNKKEGGAPKSKHLYGIAADVRVKDATPKQVYEYLTQRYPDKYGIGLYRSWVHIDVRSTKARW